jgi:ribosome recycling factor
MVPISQVANVTLLDARTISVQPWEKVMAAKIERAIRESDLGLNPSSQGELLRVPMPGLTEERRRELTKVVRNAGEDAKIAVRSVRREANEHLKKMLKDKTASEDDERRAQDEVQRLTDRTIAEIDRLVQGKEAEVMAV